MALLNGGVKTSQEDYQHGLAVLQRNVDGEKSQKVASLLLVKIIQDENQSRKHRLLLLCRTVKIDN